MILVVAEHRDGVLNRATWEAVAAAQQLAGGGMPLTDRRCSGRPTASPQELAAAGVGDVLTVADPALEPYTPDGYVTALAQVIASSRPE